MDWLPDPIAVVRFAVLFVGAVTIFRWLKVGAAKTWHTLGLRWRSRTVLRREDPKR